MSVVSALNARFKRDPSLALWPEDGTLADAGILVHCFDDWEDPRHLSPWRPSGDQSASLVFAAHSYPGGRIPLYQGDCAGRGALVFRPGATRILCGKGLDSGGHCGPLWCPAAAESEEAALETWDPNVPGDGCHGASWRTEDFAYFLGLTAAWGRHFYRLEYNEIIIDGDHWTEHLPHPIQAFVHVDGVSAEAREVHQRFLQRYRLGDEDVPLLMMRTHDWTAPFSVIE